MGVGVWVEESVAVAWHTAVVDAPAGWGCGAAVAVLGQGGVWRMFRLRGIWMRALGWDWTAHMADFAL